MPEARSNIAKSMSRVHVLAERAAPVPYSHQEEHHGRSRLYREGANHIAADQTIVHAFESGGAFVAMGTQARMLVPMPGVDSIANSPPITSILSRMLIKPRPAADFDS
jgi:hypothetical protein